MMKSFLHVESLSQVASLTASLTMKAAVIILLAALIVSTWRTATAATRHWIWLSAIAGVFLLLPLSVGLPEWQVPVRGWLTAAQSAPVAEVAFDASAAATPLVGFTETGWPTTPLSSVDVAETSTWSSTQWIGVLWALGALAIALHFLMGMARAWIWARRSALITDETWTALSRDLRWMMGINRDVELRWHHAASTPMTWGVSRPVILLPRSAAEWTPERRRVVLLHELAHVRRLDCLSQGFVQLTCALNWYNPLMWFAASRMQRERERACDDYVLQYGAKPSNYASHLLEIARSAKNQFAVPAGAVAMARRSELEGRLMAILEPSAHRGGIRSGSAIIVAVLFLSTILPLAAFTPTAHDSGDASAMNAPYVESVGDESGVVDPGVAAYSTPDARRSADAGFASEETVVGFPADVIRRQFSVNPGGRLSLDTDIGSIQLRTGSNREVTVEITRSARQRGNVDDIEFTFHHSGNDVRVEGRRRVRNLQNLNVRYVVTVPSRYNVDLKTAGGSIEVDDLDGFVLASTSGGSLRFGQISGDVKARTSGGSISLEGSGGDANLRTSGGSINLGSVQGDVDVHTSGGSITVREAGGNLVAVTSGGSIKARLNNPPKLPVRLETSGGSITLDLDARSRVSVNARTSSGRVTTDFDVPERPRDRQSTLRADINGGGPEVSLRTSAGNIRINRLGATGDSRRSMHDSETRDTEMYARWAGDDLSGMGHAELEARMEELGERIGAWAEKVAENSVAPVIAWVESPEFESWVEGLSLSATELSLQIVEDVLSSIDAHEVDAEFLHGLDALPDASRERILRRMSRDHPDAEVRRQAACVLNDNC